MLLLIMAGILRHVGVIMIHNPPRNINYWVGFRTKEAMKDQVKWDEFKKILGRNLKKASFVSLLLGLLLSITEVYAFFIGKVNTLFAITLITDVVTLEIILLVIILVTNKSVRRFS